MVWAFFPAFSFLSHACKKFRWCKVVFVFLSALAGDSWARVSSEVRLRPELFFDGFSMGEMMFRMKSHGMVNIARHIDGGVTFAFARSGGCCVWRMSRVDT